MMKRFEQLNYYEILEVPVGASSFEIRQAYKEALSLYDEDSLSTYALFSGEERERILQIIEEAFYTLVDENKRDAYIKGLVDEGRLDIPAGSGEERKVPIPLFHQDSPTTERSHLERIRGRIAESGSKELAAEILSRDLISGNDLRACRNSMGIGLQEVYEITRISVSSLQALEEDRYDRLPPLIYVKNFLRSYAELLGLDVQKVIDGYVRHMSHKI